MLSKNTRAHRETLSLVYVCNKEGDKRDGLRADEPACQIRCGNERVQLCTVETVDWCQGVLLTLCQVCV